MILLLPIVYALVWCAHLHWGQLGAGKEQWEKLFFRWVIQGIAIPLGLWAAVNAGLMPGMTPFVPVIAMAQNYSQSWVVLWVGYTAAGATFIGIYWTAVTYAWLASLILSKAGHDKDFWKPVAAIGLLSGSAGFAVVWFSDHTQIGLGIVIWLLPVVHSALDLQPEMDHRPMYSRAIARLKFGKYTEAEQEVISQLEKRENDFEGWILLAELYATQFRNIRDAAQVILDICKDPKAQPIQISLACHKLADWQLELESNPEGAKAALELLCRKLPGTHFEHMAELRIKQLPKSEEELREIKNPKPIALPSLREEFDPAAKRTGVLSRSEALGRVNEYVERLTADPNDIAAREKLAFLYAESIGEPDFGIDQLRLLIDLAEPSEEQKAKWLAQIAAWHLHLKKDEEKFKAALNEIISDYPQTAQAFAAQRRLYLLEMRMAGN
jgi:hypothetical protein